MASQDPEPNKIPPGTARAVAVAWTLPFTLVVPMFLGGVIGYFLDRWLHTKPALLLVLGLLGLGIGIYDVVKSASLLDKKDGG
ncbi:MAG: AtpZ/AtpI family protein [Candidatus Acidiferrales bacterium]